MDISYDIKWCQGGIGSYLMQENDCKEQMKWLQHHERFKSGEEL